MRKDIQSKSLLSRCLESAEFVSQLEGWKRYIIFIRDGVYYFAPYSLERFEKYGDDVVVVMKRKKK